VDGDKDDEVILRSLKDVVFVPHESSFQLWETGNWTLSLLEAQWQREA
jgi:hypothetical protein